TWYFHNGSPKSRSIAWIVCDCVPRKTIDLNPRKPISRSRITGGVRVMAAFGSYSSFSFHRNLNDPNAPGFTMDAGEMRGSVFTHAVRCASYPLVVHSAPPRPCACSSAAPEAHEI